MSVITLESLAAAFAKKDAEIERLKDEYLKLDEKLEQALRKNENQATLITELCDALKARNQLGDTPLYLEAVAEVLQRTREATR